MTQSQDTIPGKHQMYISRLWQQMTIGVMFIEVTGMRGETVRERQSSLKFQVCDTQCLRNLRYVTSFRIPEGAIARKETCLFISRIMQPVIP